MNLQTVVARHFSPMDQVLLTIGTFHSGHQFNVIPGEAVLEGTTRYFDLKLGDELRRFIGQLASQTAAAYGASVHMEYRQRVPSVVANEAASSRIAGEAVRKVLGDAALAEVEPTMIGEDFSYYLEKKPGCFAFFGAANPEKGIVHAHHNSRFNIDEDVLAGAAPGIERRGFNHRKSFLGTVFGCFKRACIEFPGRRSPRCGAAQKQRGEEQQGGALQHGTGLFKRRFG